MHTDYYQKMRAEILETLNDRGPSVISYSANRAAKKAQWQVVQDLLREGLVALSETPQALKITDRGAEALKEMRNGFQRPTR